MKLEVKKIIEKFKKNKFWTIIGAVQVILMVLILFLIGNPVKVDSEPQIDLNAVLEKIVNIDELSSFKTVYKGVATVYNEKKPEKVDFYVKYNATVTASINISEIDLKKDDNNKKIIVEMPGIIINEPNLSNEEFDFIFINSKANTPGAYKNASLYCEKDVMEEASKNETIKNLAKNNAENIIRALISPFTEINDTKYVVEFKW